MCEWIKKLMGIQSPGIKQLVKDGVTIVDVRTPQEYEKAGIRGSINIPLDQLRNNYPKIGNKNDPVILCCASGVRSAIAKKILQSKGFSTIYNAGNWRRLQKYASLIKPKGEP